MSMRRTDGLCPTCCVHPKEDDGSYCTGCRRARDRKYQRVLKKNPLKRVTRAVKNACNCGDTRCDGRRCESIRYGTAGV